MVIQNKLITAKLLTTPKIVEVFEMCFTKTYCFKCVLTKERNDKKIKKRINKRVLGKNAKCSI